MAQAKKYTEYKGLNMPSIEQAFLAKWKGERTFEKSISEREGKTPFVFYEGPPSANGLPGIHHVISRTLKDLVCRYKTMQGFQVKRKAGWDTHGLPVELGVEKELGITKEDIGKKISVEEYNAACKKAVMRYTAEWESITEKMGYWVDMKDPYITFDTKYIETLWWCLKELHKKDLLYKSVSIQPYSPAAGTGLSSHELNQPGTYKDVKDTTVVAMFKMQPPSPLKGELANAQGSPKTIELILSLSGETNVYFMAWTTTPWTLPSNCGLTVGPNIDYVLVKTFNPYTHHPCNVILARALVGKYFKPEGENGDFKQYLQLAGAGAENSQQGRGDTITRSSEDAPTSPSGGSKDKMLIPWQILAEFKGKDLEGIRYEQLLPFANNTPELSGGDPFRVILGDFVTTEDGTGIVHTAPAFGADDFKVGKKAGIGMFTLVDKQGKFIDGTDNLEKNYFLSGRHVKDFFNEEGYKDVDLDIALHLKAAGLAFKVEKYEHTYPHCWRTDKPILYYPLDAWFIRTTAAKERMIELNKTINWKPKSTGEGRFGNWLENMVDWNLSRSRYWGTPLPVWVSEDGTEVKCIGSIKELEDEIKHANSALGTNQFIHPSMIGDNYEEVRDSFSEDGKGIDLHKPWVDEIVLATKDGKPMQREPDLIDVWFDSGAMPYAQLHYPFENKGELKHNFPADFIAEGVDQTRGWFYTLHALGVLLFDSVAYKTVVSNGLVLDKNGAKMSKRVGNVINPFETIDKYSADATRWYLITNASPWDSLKFDVEGIGEVQRKFFGTLYNTYGFFALYANVDGFDFSEKAIPVSERPEIDRWILSSLQSLVAEVTVAFDDYEPTNAGRAIETFVDAHLSNWYVRLCRRRFWKGEYEQDKISAYQTLYECLETLSRLMAPISPFFADWLFTNLNTITGKDKSASVHLARFPESKTAVIDRDLEERMALAQDISSLILSIRKKEKQRVRQPLQKALVPILNDKMARQISAIQDLILNEVNVKELQLLTDTECFIQKKVKPQFKVLGVRFGAQMKNVAAAITAMTPAQISELDRAGETTISVDGQSHIIKTDEVEITAEDIPGWSVASRGALTVALDLTLTPALIEEGLAREFVNRVQKIRKDEGLELTDRIHVKVAADENVKPAILNYNTYICAEILADNIEFQPNLSDGINVDLEGLSLNILITKI